MKAIIYLFMLMVVITFSSSCIVTGELGNDSATAAAAAAAASTPNDATSLTWVEGNAYDTNNLNITWTPSSSSGVTAQTLNFYASEDCSGAAIAAVPAITLSDSTYNWNGFAIDNTGYTFSITSTNANGSTVTCSNSSAPDADYDDAGEIYIDFDAVNTATIGATSWWGGDTHPHTTGVNITATWTPPVSGAMTSQEIYIYTATAPHATPVTVDCTVGTHSASAVLASTGTSTYPIVATSGTAYAYRIRTRAAVGLDDFYSSCSTPILVDTTNPTAPTALGWVQASPTATSPITATWTLGSNDIIKQVISYYALGACAGAVASTATINDGTTNTKAFTPPGSGTYSYKIDVTDSAGLTNTSACSSDIVYDTTAPTAASALLWSLSSPTNVNTVAAMWTINAVDVADQDIIYYNDSTTCATVGTTVASLGAVVNSYTPGGGFADGTYSFKVITYDAVGNSSSSNCSNITTTSMTVDTVAPSAPIDTNLTWTQTSPTNSNFLTANWGAIASTDYYTAELYSATACGGGVVTTSNSTSTSVSLTGTVDASVHSFKLFAKDYAGNSSAGVCMTLAKEVSVDKTGPATPTWASTGAQQWNADADYPVHYGPANITASWVDSADEDSYRIDIYSDATCTTFFSPDISTALAQNTITHTFAGTNGVTYYYEIVGLDTAGNESPTACSEGITYLDTEIPLTDGSVADDDRFGQSVAIYGTTAVVGSPYDDTGAGTISIFTKSGADWTLSTRISGRDAAGCAASDSEHFGTSVAIDINTIIVGVPDKAGGGAACIYTLSGATWTFTQMITASDNGAGDGFGTSVDISGAFAIIGAPYWDDTITTDDGAAYVFYNNGTTWSEDDILTGGDPNSNDYFGTSVAIDAVTTIVGAPGYDGGGTNRGTVYIFEYTGSWSEEVQYPSGVIADNSDFGSAVDIDGTRALVGASGAGIAYAYDKAAVWDSGHADTGIAAAKAATGYGASVSLYGNYALVGAPNTAGGGVNQGAAYIYYYDGAWNESSIAEGTPGDTHFFGTSVGLFGTTSVVGAPQTGKASPNTGNAYIEL